MNKWNKRFFGICEEVASWSGDHGRHVGAVIVGPDNEIRSTGYNDLPRKVIDLPERRMRETGEKYYFTCHAEENAITNAARMGIALKGTRIWCNLFPCSTCARMIIQSGIIELNTYEPPDKDLIYNMSFEISKKMMDEAGIIINFFDK
jgi:dCMP deaminase